MTVTATADGIDAPTAQGLHLVPRLIASRTQGVEVDANRADGEYPGDQLDIGTLWEGEQVTAEDASGSTWVTYDDEALHVFVRVIDDTLGALLTPQDNKQRFRTDSVEIMIDPRGTSENTSTTFILGVLPGTDRGGGIGAPAAGRDHDNCQGPVEETAPSVTVAAHVTDPYSGYVIEASIPYDELPDGIDPKNIGFNVVVYDSDTQDRTGQSRIGWSTFPGVQADPYRWGVLQLPDAPAGDRAPLPPTIPDSAARSVESPGSIHQCAQDGMGLGGAPALPRETLTLDRVQRDGGTVTGQLNAAVAGTLRLLAWDGHAVLGTAQVAEVGVGAMDVAVSLTTPPAVDATVRLLASLENAQGTAAASAEVR